MGDLNAGCTYVEEWELASMYIYNRDYFFWPLGLNVDTTTTTTTACPYDRFVDMCLSSVHSYKLYLALSNTLILKSTFHHLTINVKLVIFPPFMFDKILGKQQL